MAVEPAYSELVGIGSATSPDDLQYKVLDEFRHAIRRILADSEMICSGFGLTTQRFQALLAIRASEKPGGMSIGDLADRLFLRHHSAVELVDRLEATGLLTRASDPGDRRRVLLQLTPDGSSRLEHLTKLHLETLSDVQDSLLGMMRPDGD